MTNPALDELIELKRKLHAARPDLSVSLTWYGGDPLCSIAWTDTNTPEGVAIIEMAKTERECVERFLARSEVQARLAEDYQPDLPL